MNAPSLDKQDFGVPVRPLLEPNVGPHDAYDRSGDAFVPVTPDNDNDLPELARAIAFGVAGDLRIIDGRGVERLIPSGVLAAGALHSIKIRRVFADQTTADDIWVAY